MINGYDIAWGTILALGAPVWLLHPRARRKVTRALAERMGRGVAPAGDGPGGIIHPRSKGEIDATRALVRLLGEARPGLRFVISTTTDTGSARARELYGTDPNVTLIRYPLDFSTAIARVLDGVRPSVVVLMELEVWPNFIRHCRRRGIPVLVVNGRITDSSFRNYRRARPWVAPMFRGLSGVCAQDETYAKWFVELGAPPEATRVTGTMKFDTAPPPGDVAGAQELAAVVGLRPGEEKIWVCGSTGPEEEEIILHQYASLRSRFPDLRLVLVPRHPERFDEVAGLIEREDRLPLVRRSRARSVGAAGASRDAVVLGDTTGELAKFYSLADVVFVGRTLVDLGARQRGSNMIEPAALGKPTIVGEFTQNFADAMRHFREAKAVKVVYDGDSLNSAVAAVLSQPAAAAEMGRRAREVVLREQGATARNVEVILQYLPPERAG
jgi:3-deoxy-D-manno-octulosonic-acid transferase